MDWMEIAMKKLIEFWKKDIINKLILLISLALVIGVLGMAVAAFTMLGGRSFMDAFTGILPARATPTFNVNSFLTPRTVTPILQTATPRPTRTLTPTDLPTLIPTDGPSPTFEAFMTLGPAATLEPAATLPAVATPTQAGPIGLACIPGNPRKTGHVVEVLDGNTVRILIDGLVYVVRYIGVTAPDQPAFITAAKAKNQELAYGEEVTLIPDVNAKDDRGRLLYYVMVGDKFINLEMIRQGLGLAVDFPPDSACAATFTDAQQSAMTAKLGLWSAPETTP